MIFSEVLLAWYAENKRDLPWRNIANPYHIWLSEVILQQTRVKQGLPYYEAFTTRFPTIHDLANASEEEVMRTWQGLGYYSRARNMHTTAKYISTALNGTFPTTKEALIKLKGIGEYTASAIASFAFGAYVSVVDGNVFRVLARFFGIDADISSPKGIKEFQALAQSILPTQDTANYNQAIMEFGALQCTPQKPNCMYCPLQASCVAFGTGRQDILPIKTLKIKQKERFFNYTILQYSASFAMRRREVGDIWAGLYDFILEEVEGQASLEIPTFLQEMPQGDFTLLNESAVMKHQLTHQTLYIKFWTAQLQDHAPTTCLPDGYAWHTLQTIQTLPKPILIANLIDSWK